MGFTNKRGTLAGALAAIALAGCASVPTGPSVMALPGTGKSFDQFRLDDQDCRNYALVQTGGVSANRAATDSGVKSAAVGTAVGAAAGAAFGGHSGAGVGAGAGLLLGSMVGLDAAEGSARGTQRQYDYAYIQCMYAKGERVPVSAGFSPYYSPSRGYIQNTPPPPSVPPPNTPPPAGAYPPPPPAGAPR